MTRWTPIATIPKDGTRVLLLLQNGFVTTGRWGGKHIWSQQHLPVTLTATHWAPLPEDPE